MVDTMGMIHKTIAKLDMLLWCIGWAGKLIFCMQGEVYELFLYENKLVDCQVVIGLSEKIGLERAWSGYRSEISSYNEYIRIPYVQIPEWSK